jgi:hypothetical protein
MIRPRAFRLVADQVSAIGAQRGIFTCFMRTQLPRGGRPVEIVIPNIVVDAVQIVPAVDQDCRSYGVCVDNVNARGDVGDKLIHETRVSTIWSRAKGYNQSLLSALLHFVHDFGRLPGAFPVHPGKTRFASDIPKALPIATGGNNKLGGDASKHRVVELICRLLVCSGRSLSLVAFSWHRNVRA